MLAGSHEDLIGLIEKQAHNKEANTEILVRAYKEFYNDRPIIKLMQDINQRIGLYKNLLEQIKRLADKYASNPSEEPGLDDEVNNLKIQYENLGLIPKDNLPNPTAQSVCRYILEKLSAFALAILDVIAKHASSMAEELRISPEVTIVFQVGVGWSPDITIGIERSGSRVRAVAQPAT
jgi:hypothetical protein